MAGFEVQGHIYLLLYNVKKNKNFSPYTSTPVDAI